MGTLILLILVGGSILAICMVLYMLFYAIVGAFVAVEHDRKIKRKPVVKTTYKSYVSELDNANKYFINTKDKK